MLSAFATARTATMHVAALQSPDLLWWKAQLRKRYQAMERMQRPALAISTATVTASIVILVAVLTAAWKQIHWIDLFALLTPSGWNNLTTITLAAGLFGFITVVILIGLRGSEGRS